MPSDNGAVLSVRNARRPSPTSVTARPSQTASNTPSGRQQHTLGASSVTKSRKPV